MCSILQYLLYPLYDIMSLYYTITDNCPPLMVEKVCAVERCVRTVGRYPDNILVT